MRKGDMKRGAFGPSILYSRSTFNTESEYMHIDYDSHVCATIANFSDNKNNLKPLVRF
jgi:hypothetical protein